MQIIAQIKQGKDPNTPASFPDANTWTVEEMFSEYAKYLHALESAERIIADEFGLLNIYLADWKLIPISQITRTMARERHRYISTKHGKFAVSHALRLFQTAHNLALRVMNDVDSLPDNLVNALMFNKVHARNRILMPNERPD